MKRNAQKRAYCQRKCGNKNAAFFVKARAFCARRRLYHKCKRACADAGGWVNKRIAARIVAIGANLGYKRAGARLRFMTGSAERP